VTRMAEGVVGLESIKCDVPDYGMLASDPLQKLAGRAAVAAVSEFACLLVVAPMLIVQPSVPEFPSDKSGGELCRIVDDFRILLNDRV